MAKVHYVKKALKDNPVAKKGEPYYWWKLNRFTSKKYSKTKPKPSELISSPFYRSVEELRESISAATASEPEDLQTLRDEWTGEIENIRDECQGSLDNMPEGLQQGDTGQQLQERIDAMDSWISDLEGVDIDIDVESLIEGKTQEEADQVVMEAVDQALSEMQSCEPSI